MRPTRTKVWSGSSPRGDGLITLFLPFVSGFAGTLEAGKAFKEILDQIFGIFTTRRETDQIVRETEFGARFGRNRGVRHRGGMAQEGLNASEAFAKREEAARGGEGDDLVTRSIQFERNHATEAGHLLSRDIVAGVGSKSRKIGAADERVMLERFGNSCSVLFVALHSEFECFQSAQCEPTVERSWDGTGGILEEFYRLEDGWIPGEGRALNQVRVTCEIFRDAVNDDVGAEFEGLLKTGRGKGVVDDHERAATVRQKANGRYVVDEEARIRGRFDPNEFRPRSDRCIESRGIGKLIWRTTTPIGWKTLLRMR